MATDKIMMAKMVLPLFLGCFLSDLFILAGNDDMHERSNLASAELAALEKNPIDL